MKPEELASFQPSWKTSPNPPTRLPVSGEINAPSCNFEPSDIRAEITAEVEPPDIPEPIDPPVEPEEASHPWKVTIADDKIAVAPGCLRYWQSPTGNGFDGENPYPVPSARRRLKFEGQEGIPASAGYLYVTSAWGAETTAQSTKTATVTHDGGTTEDVVMQAQTNFLYPQAGPDDPLAIVLLPAEKDVSAPATAADAVNEKLYELIAIITPSPEGFEIEQVLTHNPDIMIPVVDLSPA